MSEMIENEVVENEVTTVVCENCDCEHHETSECTGECVCCTAENNANWGEVGHEIPGKFYQVYNGGKVLFDDESIYYSFDSESKSEVSVEPVFPNYKANKFGKIAKNEIVKVTVTVNEKLASDNPFAHVVIDGKTYDLGILSSAVEFFMNKDHRISIHWSENLVETFRFIAVK